MVKNEVARFRPVCCFGYKKTASLELFFDSYRFIFFPDLLDWGTNRENLLSNERKEEEYQAELRLRGSRSNNGGVAEMFLYIFIDDSSPVR